MNMNSKNKAAEIRLHYERVMENRTEEEKIESDTLALMASFLSRIESVLEERQVTKKALAKEIKTSPSYLTQVFRGDKPLNFVTLTKIQRALDIQFKIEIATAERLKATQRKQKSVLIPH